MANHLLSLLARLGLSNDEARILLVLYEHPAVPAGRVAEYAGFKRGHTYNLLSSLIGAGLVQERVERGVKRFSPVSANQLSERVIEQRVHLTQLAEELTVAAPLLEALAPKGRSAPRIQLFRGSEGVKELYQFTLSSQEKVIRAIGDFGVVFPRRRSPELNKWLWQYAKRRAKNGITYRGIITKSADSDLAFRRRRAEKRELKLLRKAKLSVELNIFDRYVAISSTDEEMMGVLIESQPIAQSAKEIFEALWATLPAYSLGRGKKISRSRHSK